jgi:hypothetical protein
LELIKVHAFSQYDVSGITYGNNHATIAGSYMEFILINSVMKHKLMVFSNIFGVFEKKRLVVIFLIIEAFYYTYLIFNLDTDNRQEPG